MLNFFSDVILRYRFKKKVKDLGKQSKKSYKDFKINGYNPSTGSFN